MKSTFRAMITGKITMDTMCVRCKQALKLHTPPRLFCPTVQPAYRLNQRGRYNE
jgi:hypothetical protein